MEHNPSWEAKSSSCNQEIPQILWNPKVHFRIYKRLQPVSILSQINPVHASPSNYLKFDFNIILTSTPRSSMSSLSLMSPHPIPVCNSPVAHTYYMHRLLCSKKNIRPDWSAVQLAHSRCTDLTYSGGWSFDTSFSLVFFVPKAGDCA